MNVIDDYKLPDAELLTPSGEPQRMMVWVPDRLMVVIGNGSDALKELRADNIDADNVPVIRRGSGGCSVVLSPKMYVASFALYGQLMKDSIGYFKKFNAVIINALESLGVDGLKHEGISDIALNGRKIAGTALYRNKDVVFYHAVINIAESPSLIERYLALPPRMPDYRENRSHEDFVTSLAEQGKQVDIEDFRKALVL